MTVLLVDDDPFMLRMLAPRLGSLPIRPSVDQVLSAQTPEAALAHLDRAPRGPLAVLSDFNLKASMNGLQLLGEVKRRRPDAVRILFSGYSQEQIGDVTGDGAAQAFLEKPLRIDDMIVQLAPILSERLAAADA